MKISLFRSLSFCAVAAVMASLALAPACAEEPAAKATKAAKAHKSATPAVRVSDAELDSLTPAAEAGDAAAQVKLGHYYMNHYEEGFANEKKAGEWFLKAAEAGDAEAQAWYAIYLVTVGNASKESMAEAKPWARKSAEQKNPIGLYMTGILTPTKNHEERIEWFEPAAEQGFVPAMRALATDLLHGHRMEDKKDPVVKEAFKWLAKATKTRDCCSLMVASGSNGRSSSFTLGEKPMKHPFKASEKYALAAIESAMKREWAWYDTIFDFDFCVRRYATGGARYYQLIRAYLNLRSLYEFCEKENKADEVPERLVATLKKLAKEDPVGANYALADLLMKWKNFYFTGVPAPEKDYKPYAEAAAAAEPKNYCDYALRQSAAGM